MKYFDKYIKYKKKYLFLHQYIKYNQYGGNIIKKYNIIKKIYNNIPESGLYNSIETDELLSESIKKFKIYCYYLLKITNDDEYYSLLQKNYKINRKIYKLPKYLKIKKILNQNLKYKIKDNFKVLKNDIDNIENNELKNQLLNIYNDIIIKTNIVDINNKLENLIIKQGKNSNKEGKLFEKKISNKILPYISKKFKIPIKKLVLIENALLFIKNENETKLIGEIDIIVLKDKQIFIIGEIKKALDDISDALFQINRSFNTIKNYNNIILTHNGQELNQNIFNFIKKLPNEEILKYSFIFTEYDKDIRYKNLPSKLVKRILQILWSGNINNINDKFFRKLFLKTKKLQKNRYIKNIPDTISIYEKNDLLDRIYII